MDVRRIDAETETTLILTGSARVAEADQLRRGLAEALDTAHPLVGLDLSGLEEVDLTFFQLLLAFQQALVGGGRHLTLRPLPAEHPVTATARLLGLPLSHHFTLVEAVR